MEWKQRRLLGCMAAIGFLVLIFDSRLALEGARSGVELCLQTVIPSLFPFFVLSMMLTNSRNSRLSYPVQLLTRILGIPPAASSVLIPAVMGGYPVGAKCVADLYHGRQIGRGEAERMLSFCSNAGPSFLFGMVSGFFPERHMIWMFWLIHVFSAVLTALAIPAGRMDHHASQENKQTETQSIMLSAAKAMCFVCCWVILFRAIIFFLKRWCLFMLPPWAQVLLMGSLELTNGCCELLTVPEVELRFILCSCMLAFGGICVLFQTASVTKGLSLKPYVKGKLMQTGFSFLFSSAILTGHGLALLGVVPILVLILRKIQKSIEIPGFFLYNKNRTIPEA